MAASNQPSLQDKIAHIRAITAQVQAIQAQLLQGRDRPSRTLVATASFAADAGVSDDLIGIVTAINKRNDVGPATLENTVAGGNRRSSLTLRVEVQFVRQVSEIVSMIEPLAASLDGAVRLLSMTDIPLPTPLPTPEVAKQAAAAVSVTDAQNNRSAAPVASKATKAPVEQKPKAVRPPPPKVRDDVWASLPPATQRLLGSEEFGRRVMAQFTKADANNNGVLEKEEVLTVLQLVAETEGGAVGDAPSADDVNDLLEGFDTDGNGVLGPEEFVEFAKLVLVESLNAHGPAKPAPPAKVDDSLWESLPPATQKMLASEEFGAHIMRLFREADADGNGTLDKTEVLELLKIVAAEEEDTVGAAPPTAADVDEMFEGFDEDGDGVLSVDEFVEFAKLCLVTMLNKAPPQPKVRCPDAVSEELWASLPKSTRKLIGSEKFGRRVMRQFAVADVDGNGVLDKSEILRVLNVVAAEESGDAVGPPPTAADVDDMLAGFDEDGDGALSMEEFVEFAKLCLVTKVNEEGVAQPAAPGAVRDDVWAALPESTRTLLGSEEFGRRVVRQFTKADGDSNGRLNKEEVLEVLKIVAENEGGAVGDAPTAADVDDLLAGFDTNGDGMLDLEEFVEFAKLCLVTKMASDK